MLGVLFAFSGRLKRLPYFLIGVLAFCLFVGVVATLAVVAGPSVADLKTNPEAVKGLLPLVPVFLVALLLNGWVSLSTQACRIRDIGWNPVIVIPAWMGLLAFGEGMSLSAHGLAPAIGLANLGMTCCLLFWPSKADEPTFGGDFMDVAPRPQAPPRMPSAPTAAPMFQAPPPAEPAQPQPRFAPRPPVGPPAFGRRGLAPR
jgi:uncharacterized membrane protein YhaH (DUF805 family)